MSSSSHQHSAQNTHPIPPKPPKETLEAIQTEMKCGLMAGASALLDLVAYGWFLADWRSTVRTIWKITFCLNIYQAFTLFQSFKTKIERQKLNPHFPFQYHVGKMFLRLMEIMTQVWRLTAIMVILTSTSFVFLAWSDVIDHFRGGLMAVVLLIFAYVSFQSNQETKDMAHVDPAEDKSALIHCVKRQGAVMVRTMATASTAFFFEVALLPMVVAANLRIGGWHNLIVALLQIPTPIAVGTNLISFRRQYLQLLTEISNRHKRLQQVDPNALPWHPQSEQALALAAQDFYAEVILAFQIDMVAKTLFILRELTTTGE